MNFGKTFTLILFLTSVLFSQDFHVETLDEQKHSNNLLVLRFRIINNTSVTIRNASLKYCLTKNPDKDIDVDKYYISNTQIFLENVDSANVCLNIKIDSIPNGVYPNHAGYSIGIHNQDWSSRNKTLDYSNPQSSTFSKADNVAVYTDDSILYGSDYQIISDSDAYLPEAAPFSAFDGISITLGPNEPYRFVWNYVENAEKYLLTVLREDSSLVHRAEYVANVADVYLPAGRYLWNVQTINSEKTARPFAATNRYSKMELLESRSNDEGFRIGGTDTIISTSGRKDSRLLNVSWGNMSDFRKWDTIHEPPNPISRPLDEDENNRCWAIAIYNLNHHYRMANGEKGNLTLDEIVALGNMHQDSLWSQSTRMGPVLSAFKRGGNSDMESHMLQWALNVSEPKFYSIDDNFNGHSDSIKTFWIDSLVCNKPIYVVQKNLNGINHVMLVDGFRYRSNDSVEFHFVNTDNYGSNEWRLWGGQNWRSIVRFTFISDVDSVRETLPEVHADSDSDGIMDFDELYRFDSEYNSRDSDNDGIDDKTEIYSYVIRESVKLGSNRYPIQSNNYPVYINITGISKETFADIDGDGKRAENDSDSDNDSIKDGDEDLNHNGLVDEGETDPYHRDDTDSTENTIPDNVIIYSLDYIRIGDGVRFYSGSSEKAIESNRMALASEAKDDISIIVGARAKIGDIYSKGQVWVRSQGIVGPVRYYGKPQIYTTILQDMSVSSNDNFYNGLIDFNYDQNIWPWFIPEFTTKITNANKEIIVQSGKCDTLRNYGTFNRVKVEAGGTLYFDEGEITVNNLQLDAGSSIDFVKPGFSTVLHVNESVQWNTTIKNESLNNLAKGFKLCYYGDERFFIHGEWAGTVVAPNAKLVLGQTHNKEILGQFLGRGVSVHQYSKIYKVPFNPQKSAIANMLHDVAWLGVQK